MERGEGIVDKLPLISKDVLTEKIARIREEFPEVLSEGKIDFQRLKMALGDLVDNGRERYGLSWAGKTEAIRNIQTPSVGTLLPIQEESVNFETSENLIIEGDNLEVLKLLQKSYHAQVKMIYIDPPYNTGNEFIYPDNFREGLEDYLKYSGQTDEDGIKLSTNTDTDGRFHSKWLNMMYPRLFLARNLLRHDGVIFVSIDDNEIHNLRCIMDEIFGTENFVAHIVWKHTQQSKNDEPYFSRHHNAIIVYRRSDSLPKFRLDRTEEDNKAYSNPDNDPKGPWRSGDVRSPSFRATLRYVVKTPSGKEIQPPDNGWRWSRESMDEKIASGEIIFSQDESRIIRKIYLADQEGRTPENVWTTEEAGSTREATQELKDLFDGESPFDTPKPSKLVQRMLQLAMPDGKGIVLDFFAGSGTTASAVLNLNREDGGSRKFILVQLPEPTSDRNYKTISDITKERVRRVIRKMDADIQTGLNLAGDHRTQDRGFRVFRLSSSNFKYWSPESSTDPKTLELQLTLFANNVLAGRKQQDLLYEIVLKSGLPLTAQIKRIAVAEQHVFSIGNDILLICLEDKIQKATLEGMVALSPHNVVCLDVAFQGNDNLKTNTKLLMESHNIEFHTV